MSIVLPRTTKYYNLRSLHNLYAHPNHAVYERPNFKCMATKPKSPFCHLVHESYIFCNTLNYYLFRNRLKHFTKSKLLLSLHIIYKYLIVKCNRQAISTLRRFSQKRVLYTFPAGFPYTHLFIIHIKLCVVHNVIRISNLLSNGICLKNRSIM